MTSLKFRLGKLLEEYDEKCWSRAIDTAHEGNATKAMRIMYHGIPIGTARHYFLLAQAQAESKQNELKTWYTYSRFFYYVLFNRLKSWLDKPFLPK